MEIVVFRLTEVDCVWFVWPIPTPQVYSFESKSAAQRFARRLARNGGTLVQLERSLAQAAALI